MYVVFLYLYKCRVAHGHRQVGRLALRTSDTCNIYKYKNIYIYIHIYIDIYTY